MSLSNDLISQFVKTTNDKQETKKESTSYGTAIIQNGKTYVKLDGSDTLTPASSMILASDGQRVVVTIKNHSAIITGSTSDPSTPVSSSQGSSGNTANVNQLASKIAEFEIAIGQKVSTDALEAEVARIDQIAAENVTIRGELATQIAYVEDLRAESVSISKKLSANEAAIDDLTATKLDVEIAIATYATIANLNATNAKVNNLESAYGNFADLTADNLSAIEAEIMDLQANKLSAIDIEGKYANIDFSNISKATIQWFYANSGLIKNVVVGDGTITGELVGVTIKGDLIEGGTVKADKLVIKGTDGLYYKLNTDGVKTEAEQTEYNSINGSVILAKSITATKINVTDLVAFGATIGGFHISENSLYSGVKESVDNTTRGIYLDSDGQMAVGDGSNFFKYYKDADGNYKLIITGSSVILAASNKNVDDAINDIDDDISNVRTQLNESSNDTTALIAELISNISMLVTDGNGTSLMTQTDEGWTFSTAAIMTAVNDTSQGLNDLTKELGDTNSAVNVLQAMVDDLGTIADYVKISVYEDEPCIELGEGDSDFKLRITNTRMMFTEGSEVLAYFNNQSLHIKKAVVEEELQQGGFVWKIRSNGNLGLVWKGGNA